MIITIASLLMTLVVLTMMNYNLYVEAQEQKNSPESNTVSDIYKKVQNSVIAIKTPLTEETTDIHETVYDGSGFVYDRMDNNTVYIVTNEHVVTDYETVKVVFIEGNSYTADVIAVEPQSDIAVLQIVWNETQQPQAPEPLQIGNSSKLEVGEQVLIIGNPFQSGISYPNLLTTGIISKLGVTVDYETAGFFNTIHDAIVTDAMIVGGNSGGPLLNMQGQAVGMVTASADETTCCTYAVTSNRIKNIVPTLIENGEYIYPYLGIEFVNISPDLLEQAFEDPPTNLTGVLVTQIDKDSPAHKAGLNASITNQFGNITGGDIITALDGKPVTDANNFSFVREHKQVGDKIALTVYRNGELIHLIATLEASPY